MPLGTIPMPQTTGRQVRVSADGYPEWLPIGATIAWELITANTTNTVLTDDTPVYIGEKAIEFGTVMVKLTGGASSGKWAPYVNAAANGQGTLTKGSVGIMDMSRKANEYDSEHVGLITGGLVWKQRLKTDSGTFPTLVNLMAALTRLEITPSE